MTDEQLTPRQERAAERLLEDESLTSGLSDAQARPLIGWASAMAARAAAPERSDPELAAQLQAIRAAVRHAAAAGGPPDALVAIAEQQLAGPAPAPTIARPARPGPAACLAARRLSLTSHRP